MKTKVRAMRGTYIGKSGIYFKEGESVYVMPHHQYENMFCAFANPNATGWICNIQKWNVRLEEVKVENINITRFSR
jgi:hypothetical protein